MREEGSAVSESVFSREFAQSTSHEDLYHWFRLVLGRRPNPGEWEEHVRNLQGKPVDQVAAIYLNSLEFANRLGHLRATLLSGVSKIEFDGIRLHTRDADLEVGGQLRDRGSYEPHVTEVFKSHLKAGMSVIDIGANIGYFTMLAASLVGKSGQVIAFEPNSDNVKLLELSRRDNDFANVHVLQSAAGRETGLLVLNTSVTNGTTSQLSDDSLSLLDSTIVQCLKVDDFVRGDQTIDLIKVDVEGAEYNALLGAERTILRCKPLITSEFTPGMLPGISGVTGEEFLSYVVSLRYEISVLEEAGGVTMCGRDVARVLGNYAESHRSHIDLLFTPIGN